MIIPIQRWPLLGRVLWLVMVVLLVANTGVAYGATPEVGLQDKPAPHVVVLAGVIRSGFDESNILGRNDDGSTGQVALGFTINFFGANYAYLYINNNGNVTFNAPSGVYNPFNLTGNTGIPIIAAFFTDVDTRGAGSGVVHYGQGSVNGRPAFAVHWDHVGYYNSRYDKLNDFQLVIIDRSDRGPGDFDLEFNYAQVQWDYNNARAGYSSGTGAAGTFYEFPGSGIAGSFLDSNPNGLAHRDPEALTFQVISGSVAPDLVLNVVAAPDPLIYTDESAPESTLRYTLTITNNGGGFASSVILTNDLPDGITLTGVGSSRGSCDGVLVVTCTLGLMGPGEGASVTLDISSTVHGLLVNQADVVSNETDRNPADNTARTVTRAGFETDVAVAMAGAPEPVIAGETLNYTLTLSNVRTHTAAQVVVTTTLPLGASYQAASASQGTGCTHSGSRVVCNLGSIAPAANAGVTIAAYVLPATRGIITGSVEVSTLDIDLVAENNTAVLGSTVGARADVFVSSLNDTPDPVLADGILRYTLRAENAGPSTATSTLLTTTLSAGISPETLPPGCSGTAQIVCSLGAISPGNYRTLVLVLHVAPEVGGIVISTAEVRGSESDMSGDNNTTTQSTEVVNRRL